MERVAASFDKDADHSVLSEGRRSSVDVDDCDYGTTGMKLMYAKYF